VKVVINNNEDSLRYTDFVGMKSHTKPTRNFLQFYTMSDVYTFIIIVIIGLG